MRQARAIGIALGLVSLFMSASAHAAEPKLSIVPNESFVVPLDVSVTTGNEYRVKACFSSVLASPTTKSASGLDCQGETWNGTEWLRQTDAWDAHPTLTVTASHITGSVTLRTESITPYLYIILLDSAKSSGSRFRAPVSYLLTERIGDYSISLRGFTPSGTPVEGYFSITENGTTVLVPAQLGSTVYSKSSESLSVSLFDSTGSQMGTGNYLLTGVGIHEIVMNPPPLRRVQPNLHVTEHAFVGQDISIVLESEGDAGVVHWYEDGGLVVPTEEANLVRSYAQAGVRRFEVYLPDTKETAHIDVPVRSYQNITLKELLPNPAGRDTGEFIVLQNTNPFPVVIKDWQLRSRSSSTIIKIAAEIEPSSESTINLANRLLNRGGTYDLYNESNVLIDTVTYPEVAESELVTRDGIFWTTPSSKEKIKEEETDTVIELTGTVIKPSGKTFDIATPEGEVHVVVHPDFDGEKPRLAKGDTVNVTGVWRTSKNGRYLSVRSGHKVLLVLHSVKEKPVKAARTPKLVSAAKAAPPAHSTQKVVPQAHAPPVEVLSVSYPNQSLLWHFTLLICIGFVLALPSRPRIPV